MWSIQHLFNKAGTSTSEHGNSILHWSVTQTLKLKAQIDRQTDNKQRKWHIVQLLAQIFNDVVLSSCVTSVIISKTEPSSHLQSFSTYYQHLVL